MSMNKRMTFSAAALLAVAFQTAALCAAEPARALDFSGSFPTGLIRTVALVMPACILNKSRFDSGKDVLEAAAYRVKVMPRLDFK